MAEYLVGTGGWAYFNVPGRTALRAYSDVFNFVEVNSTFYEYPSQRTVKTWRRIVPNQFVFSVRCNQDLTHRIGLKPVEAAFEVFYRIKAYCEDLETPFLVLETPASQALDLVGVRSARDFFASVSSKGIRLVWEYRAPFTSQVCNLMQDFNIVQCIDLSLQKIELSSDVVYSRLFGKGKHNLYQFTDDELQEIQSRAEETQAKTIILAYHGARMNSDAARFQLHQQIGKFMPITDFVGVDSAKSVLSEDATFPASKSELIANQGWKVFDLTANKRIHIGEVLGKLPDRTYSDLSEVVEELKAII